MYSLPKLTVVAVAASFTPSEELVMWRQYLPPEEVCSVHVSPESEEVQTHPVAPCTAAANFVPSEELAKLIHNRVVLSIWFDDHHAQVLVSLEYCPIWM